MTLKISNFTLNLFKIATYFLNAQYDLFPAIMGSEKKI